MNFYESCDLTKKVYLIYDKTVILIYFIFQIISADKSLPVSMTESKTASTTIHPTSQQLAHVDENFNPNFIYTLKQISSSQVLRSLAKER